MKHVPNTTLKLGTRRSLLAMTQSTWVARELERLHPGLKVDLIGIETRGDQIVDIPLRQIEGKDFFVAELDRALLQGDVDFCVHSLKDLSLTRPEGICLAATPKRQDPRDVLILGPDAEVKLSRGLPIKIGTSSPRRLETMPGFLARALPQLSPEGPHLDWVEIRGNVPTRLARLHESPQSDRHLDGVVLALAGLERLHLDPNSRAELLPLLKGVRRMVFPLAECPTAPGQAALAIEARTSDREVVDILRALHDPDTQHAIEAERRVHAEWGGGCHQRFGVTQLTSPLLGPMTWIRGSGPKGEHLDELRWNSPPLPKGKVTPWNGMSYRSPHEVLIEIPKITAQAVLIAHDRALPEPCTPKTFTARIWTSGTASWFRLAQRGFWVEGCAEGMGFGHIRSTLERGALQLPPFKDWLALTHEGALESWADQMPALATYRMRPETNQKAADALGRSTHAYWSSASQYALYRDYCPLGLIHACGPGKTARFLSQSGINALVFPNAEEWKQWLTIKP